MIERFEQLLKARIGLEAESVGRVVIERAVRQRIRALGCADEDSYWTHLNASLSEHQALVEAVVVPETWFFRYPESFSALGRLALERLPSLAGRPLRILSLPCSSGEEPYSITMALFDAGLVAQQFHIDAMDISDAVLKRASEGVYGRNSFRGNDQCFRDRYFTACGDSFTLSDSVRQTVRFLSGNLLEPALLMAEEPYDFVFCRNLLIYFDRPTQGRVVEVLKRLMRADGAMFIGPAEASLFSQCGMNALNIPLAFVFRHAPAAAARPAKAALPRPVAKPPLPTRSAVPARASRPALPKMGDIAAKQVEGDAALQEIASLANSGRSAEARAICERHLAQHGPSAAVFYWLGLLSDVAGQVNEAQDYYRKTLYLDPQHAEAMAHLAALLAARGDLAGAQRLQQRASRGVKPND